MAEEVKKYPLLGKNNWWKLRRKFRETFPRGEVKASYIASVLEMKKESAQFNVIPELKLIGLIDNEGKPTDLANKWRIDDKYAEVCEEIKERIYPSELLDAISDPVNNREAVVRWFMEEKKIAEKTAKIMASFYILVSQADLAAEKEVSVPPKGKKRLKPTKEEAKVKKAPKEKDEAASEASEEEKPQASLLPSIHIDLQIHLSPEAKLEQIDKIFESMAKHFKEFYPLHKRK